MTDYVAALTAPGFHVYKESAERCAESLRTGSTIDAGGVIRWNSNNSVPPVECVALAVHLGLPVNVAACTAARDADLSAFFAEYRTARAKLTPAQRAEERAMALAAGLEDPVNIITGERL